MMGWLACGWLVVVIVGGLEGEGDRILVRFLKEEHLQKISQLKFMMYITCILKALHWKNQGDFSCLGLSGSSQYSVVQGLSLTFILALILVQR